MPKGKKWITAIGYRHCPVCGLDKPLHQFHKAKKSKDGRFTYCIECTQKRNKRRTPELRQKWYLMEKYGLESHEYNRLFQKQNGKCAICKQQQKRWLSVDHDHITGKIRGLLCIKCNTILGQLNDNIKLLDEVKNYLIIYNER